MVRAKVTCVVVAAIVAVGCSSKKQNAPAAGSASAASGSSVTANAGSSAGPNAGSNMPAAGPPWADTDGATITLVLWPSQWKQIEPAIAATKAKLPPEMAMFVDKALAEVREDLIGTQADQPLRQLAKKQLRSEAIPPLPLDDSRPIVASMFEPLAPVEPLLAQVLAQIGKPDPSATMAMVRHRVVVPTKDAGKAAKLIAKALGEGKLADRKGGVYSNADLLVRLEERATELVVTLVHGANVDKLDAASTERALGAKGWVPSLHPLVDAKDPAIARLHVRIDRVATVGPQLGAINIARAFEVFREPNGVELTTGYSEVLTAELLPDPATATISSVVFELPAGPPHLPLAFAVPSAAGVGVLKAEPKLAAGTRVGIADLDLVAMAKVAKLAPVAQNAKLEDIVRMMHECGWACSAYFMLGNGLPLATLAKPDDIAEARKEMLEEVPALGGARIVLVGSTLIVEPLGESSPNAASRARAIAPAAAVTVSAEGACASRALVALRTGLKSIEEKPQLAPAAEKLETELKADLDCMAKDAALAPRAAGIREVLAALRKLPSK